MIFFIAALIFMLFQTIKHRKALKYNHKDYPALCWLLKTTESLEVVFIDYVKTGYGILLNKTGPINPESSNSVSFGLGPAVVQVFLLP